MNKRTPEEIAYDLITNPNINPEVDIMKGELLLKEEDLLVPMLSFFVAKKQKVNRFSDIYDSDPEFYWDIINRTVGDDIFFFESCGLTYSGSVAALKAYAVHLSPREKDKIAIQKFYKQVIGNWSLSEKEKDTIVHLEDIGIKCVEVAGKKAGNSKNKQLEPEIFYTHLWATLAEEIHNGNKITTTCSFCKTWIDGLFLTYHFVTTRIPEICEGYPNNNIRQGFLSFLKIDKRNNLRNQYMSIVDYLSQSFDAEFVKKGIETIQPGDKSNPYAVTISSMAEKMITDKVAERTNLYYVAISHLEMEANQAKAERETETIRSIKLKELNIEGFIDDYLKESGYPTDESIDTLIKDLTQKDKTIAQLHETIRKLEKSIKQTTEKSKKYEEEASDLKKSIKNYYSWTKKTVKNLKSILKHHSQTKNWASYQNCKSSSLVDMTTSIRNYQDYCTTK